LVDLWLESQQFKSVKMKSCQSKLLSVCAVLALIFAATEAKSLNSRSELIRRILETKQETSGSQKAIAPQVQRRTVDFDWDQCYDDVARRSRRSAIDDLDDFWSGSGEYDSKKRQGQTSPPPSDEPKVWDGSGSFDFGLDDWPTNSPPPQSTPKPGLGSSTPTLTSRPANAPPKSTPNPDNFLKREDETSPPKTVEEKFMKLADEIATYFIDAYKIECDNSLQCDETEIYCRALKYAQFSGDEFFYDVWGLVTEFLDEEFQEPKGPELKRSVARTKVFY